MIEVEVHNSLLAFLRSQNETYWPHHLTMARLVARALRLGRSALIQTGAPSNSQGRYRLSYLAPALLWPGPAILVVPESLQQRLLTVEIPRLRQWMTTNKAIRRGDRWPGEDFQGLLLTSPAPWLRDRIYQQGCFPTGILTIFDGADDLEEWTREQLTQVITPKDWDELMLACPEAAIAIRDARVQLTRSIFQHPENPYECYLLDTPDQKIVEDLYETLLAQCQPSLNTQEATSTLSSALTVPPLLETLPQLPAPWHNFWQRWRTDGQLRWAEISRRQGLFSLSCGPLEVASVLSKIWPQQPIVFIGGWLDLETQAPVFRQRIGLENLTCVKFAPDRQNELIQLYVPERLPLPNTPQFQPALIQEIRTLICLSASGHGLTLLLVGDVPLKAQVGTHLAAEFGSRVQVEKTCLDENGILVTGWEFWREHQEVLPAPQLLIIATLPIPSLENPLVAGRVSYYKQLRQDWFRLYLLPTALNELQRAIAPLRERQGVVALLDSRVLHRSYGSQVLTALSPLARIDYLEPSWFSPVDYSMLE